MDVITKTNNNVKKLSEEERIKTLESKKAKYQLVITI